MVATRSGNKSKRSASEIDSATENADLTPRKKKANGAVLKQSPDTTEEPSKTHENSEIENPTEPLASKNESDTQIVTPAITGSAPALDSNVTSHGPSVSPTKNTAPKPKVPIAADAAAAGPTVTLPPPVKSAVSSQPAPVQFQAQVPKPNVTAISPTAVANKVSVPVISTTNANINANSTTNATTTTSPRTLPPPAQSLQSQTVRHPTSAPTAALPPPPVAAQLPPPQLSQAFASSLQQQNMLQQGVPQQMQVPSYLPPPPNSMQQSVVAATPNVIKLTPMASNLSTMAPTSTNTVSLQVTVPNDKVGLIIGKGGATVKGIQAKHSCTVQIPTTPDENDPTVRTLTVVATTTANAEKGREEVLAVCTGTQGPLPTLIPAGFAETLCTIPNDKVGLVIGKGGMNIKQVQQETRCQVQIPGVPDPGSNPPTRTLSICGPPENIRRCVDEITRLVYRQLGTTSSFGLQNLLNSQAMQSMGGSGMGSLGGMAGIGLGSSSGYDAQNLSVLGNINAVLSQVQQQPPQLQQYQPLQQAQPQIPAQYNYNQQIQPQITQQYTQQIPQIQYQQAQNQSQAAQYIAQQPMQQTQSPVNQYQQVQQQTQTRQVTSSNAGAQSQVQGQNQGSGVVASNYKYTREEWAQWKAYYKQYGQDLADEPPPENRAY